MGDAVLLVVLWGVNCVRSIGLREEGEGEEEDEGEEDKGGKKSKVSDGV